MAWYAKVHAAAVPVLLWHASTVNAAEPAQDHAVEPTCELHLIPSNLFGAINNTSSPFSEGLVGGAVAGALAMKRPEDVKAFIEATLSEREQVSLLTEFNLPQKLALPGYRVVGHPGSAARFKTFEEPKTTGRLVEGGSHCHAELHVYSLYVMKNPLSRKFYSIFYFREFDGRQTPKFFRWAATNSSVSRIPPSREEDRAEAQAELRSAFLANVQSFITRKLKRAEAR